MQMWAINEAERLIGQLKLDCEFKRSPHYTWTCEDKKVDDIRKEYDDSIACGLPAEFILGNPPDLPESVGAKAAVRFTQQAEYNPFVFCKLLADRIEGGGSAVFEDSRVTAVTEDPLHVLTLATGTVKADHVVLATHLPIMDRSGHFGFLTPSRTHCVAARLTKPVLREMCMSADQPMRSLRVAEDGYVLIVAGESQEVGSDEDTNKCYQKLEDWARQHFPVEKIQNRWGAMDYCSSDHLPWMGYLYRGTDSIYCATGMTKSAATLYKARMRCIATTTVTTVSLTYASPPCSPYLLPGGD